MHEERDLGGLRVVTLRAPAGPAGGPDTSGPAFASARVLPDRGMMTLQVTARLPSLGETDLLWTPPAAEASRLLANGTDGFPGNGSYLLGGAVLLPFANRIAGDLAPDGRTIRTQILGRTVVLPADAGGRRPGARRFAMHGFLLDARADEVDRGGDGEEGGGDRVRAVYHAGDFGGRWLSATEVEIECALDRSSFALAVTARNAGDEPLPMGIGWHPYFALPSSRREEARLHLPARRRALVNDYDEVLPTGELAEVAGTAYDFSAPDGRALGDLYLDDCFVDLARGPAGEVTAEVVDPAAAYGLRVAGASPEIRAVQVYAPPAARYVVLEPQTNLADPFGAEWAPEVDTGMAVLAPGEAVVYRARLELFTPGRRESPPS